MSNSRPAGGSPNPVKPGNQAGPSVERLTPDEVAQLKDRVELLELKAREVEAHARILDAKHRLNESQTKLKAQRLQDQDGKKKPA